MTSKPKIQIPNIFFNEVLHEQTTIYWRISRSWHGQEKGVTVGSALDISSKVLRELSPNRPLARCIVKIRDNIIIHGSKYNMLKHEKLAGQDNNKQAHVTLL